MSGVVKIKGVVVSLGGADRTIPPITLGALEQLQERLSAFTGDTSDMKQVATVIDAAHASLKRNYPELTRADVADFLDVGNMAEVFEAIMDVSGLKRKSQEQASAAGEATGD